MSAGFVLSASAPCWAAHGFVPASVPPWSRELARLGQVPLFSFHGAGGQTCLAERSRGDGRAASHCCSSCTRAVWGPALPVLRSRLSSCRLCEAESQAGGALPKPCVRWSG